MSFTLTALSTYQSSLEQAAEYMDKAQLWFGHGTDNSWDEAVVLLLWSAALPMNVGREVLENTVEPGVAERFVAAVNRRVNERIPAPYITSEAWFCGLPFYVNQNVLVPRSPIAELIQRDFQPWLRVEPRRILDLCCGSGCIGIAAALAYPHAEVVLSDLSTDAIEVAKKNIHKHHSMDQVTAVAGNLFSAVEGQFDLILCNPPYVDARDLSEMPPEYHQEPAIGLGSGENGLDITHQILNKAANYLSDRGILILEVGNSWVSLEQSYPRQNFIWIEFENGGHGVCVLQKFELNNLSR